MMNIDLIDFHTHILPGIDDGSKSVEMTERMLSIIRNYGCRHLVATPHFYPLYDTPDDFIQRRNEAFSTVTTDIEITLGAEVAYFFGISKTKETKKLSIGNTGYILIEMPFEPWTRQQLQEIISLPGTVGLNPILAHTERYLKWQEKATWQYLKENDVLLQSNAEFFVEHPIMSKIHLKSGFVDLLGTDCHNLESRKPNLDEAIDRIKDYYLDEIIDNGLSIFGL